MKAAAFYNGDRNDHVGRSIEHYHQFTFEELELVHDYIQWMFPVPEPSLFNDQAPLLTEEDIEAFKTSPHLQDMLQRSFDMMKAFYGMEGQYRIDEGKNGFWLSPRDHNFLRITRILRCLHLCGLQEEAESFLYWLEDLYSYDVYKDVIGEVTIAYWRAAVKG
jgi:hypothetical protein